jgi:AraC family transcriptional regulator
LAKIAAEFEKAVASRAELGLSGQASARPLAQGAGWRVDDIVCDFGPHDRPFEEQHSETSIAVVAGGSFQYRGEAGSALMTPGALLLGNSGQYFECSHQHCAGDRCIAFRYESAYFDRLAADAGVRAARFSTPRLSPVRELSSLVSLACAGLAGFEVSWKELGLQLAAEVLTYSQSSARTAPDLPPSSIARISRAVRSVERNPEQRLALSDLAQEARLSPYHFLRAFQQATGLTPHQYVLRTRLREAAVRLKSEPTRILDIVFDAGFGDVSNFNRALRSEFGVSPRAYRRGNKKPALVLSAPARSRVTAQSS